MSNCNRYQVAFSGEAKTATEMGAKVGGVTYALTELLNRVMDTRDEFNRLRERMRPVLNCQPQPADGPPAVEPQRVSTCPLHETANDIIDQVNGLLSDMRIANRDLEV